MILGPAPASSISIYAGSTPPRIGGYENHVWETGKRLAALTGRVCMITPGRDEAAEASLVAERFASGLTVVRYASWWVGGGIIGIPRPVAALRLLTQPYLKTGLVMTETRFFVSSWVGWAISLLRGLPLLHVEHGGSHPETGNRVLNLVTKAIDHLAGKFLARRGTGVVAVSKAARDFLVHIGVAPDKIVVIPNGLPPHHGDCPCIRMRDGGRPKETMTLGYVGRLTDGKAVDNLIRAFNEIVPTFPEAELWIVGDGPSRRKLERLCHFLGTPQVKFLGSVEHDRMDGMYARLDVVVIPSVSEGSSLVMLEAAQHRCTIVASDLPAFATILTPDSAFVAVRPGDTRDLSNKLGLVLSGRLDLGRLTENAAESVAAWPDWDEVAARLLAEIYKSGSRAFSRCAEGDRYQ